jgi:hypothetical protein
LAGKSDQQQQQQQQTSTGWGGQQRQQQQQQQQQAEVTAAMQALLSAPDAPVSVYNDLKMVGQVVWAGKSSMEVLVELQATTSVAAAAAAVATTTTTAATTTASSSSSSSAVLGSSGVFGSNDRCLEWSPRALAHFIMVLRPTAASNQLLQEQQQSSSSSNPVVSVPQIVPMSELEKQQYGAGRCSSMQQQQLQALQGCVALQLDGTHV